MGKLLSEHLIEICERKIVKSPRSWIMGAGHNGPYFDAETPVRCVSHWLFLLCSFRDNLPSYEANTAINALLDFLSSKEARPMQGSFFCRRNPEKDLCNGLMGQAWVLEALTLAGKTLDRKDVSDLAADVFFLHPWSEERATWQRVAVDGSYLTPDGTFNHQLWFAAIASQIDDAEAKRRSERFLDVVGQHVTSYPNGVIFHASPVIYPKISMRSNHRAILGWSKSLLRNTLAIRKLYSKSVGYHAFNLYAFAMLKQSFPDHPFWTSKKFKRLLRVTRTPRFKLDLEHSAYGWPYNPPGVELAFVGEVFQMEAEYSQSWINLQYAKTFDPETDDPLVKGAPDRITAAARIYEAARLTNEYRIELPQG